MNICYLLFRKQMNKWNNIDRVEGHSDEYLVYVILKTETISLIDLIQRVPWVCTWTMYLLIQYGQGKDKNIIEKEI